MNTLADKFSSEILLVNKYMERLISVDLAEPKVLNEVAEACRYSVTNPGKRFRALLTLLTAKALGREVDYVLPYAASVELIHTYSLIHDDLPAMDDDDYRRGKPSHHKVYGEAMAIVCGDALQALAFEHIAQAYQHTPELGLKAVLALAKASGYQGMVGGQAMDILISQGRQVSREDIEFLHSLKTGQLIAAAVEGGAILCEASDQQHSKLVELGQVLGLAFQVADDIMDHDKEKPELMGLPGHIGLEFTKQLLDQLTLRSLKLVEDLGVAYSDFKFIVEFNSDRVQSVAI